MGNNSSVVVVVVVVEGNENEVEVFPRWVTYLTLSMEFKFQYH